MTRNNSVPVAGPGELAAKARRQRVIRTVVALLLAGGLVGMITALAEQNPSAVPLSGTLPPLWAVLASVVLFAAITIGSWSFFRTVDELELRDNYFASMVALYAYWGTYMVWYLLWRGQLVPEPGHEILFVGSMLVAGVAYFWKKLRP